MKLFRICSRSCQHLLSPYCCCSRSIFWTSLLPPMAHKPHKKPNSNIKYVRRASNHPPSISKNIPSSIQKRLNIISSSETEFNNAKDDYQKALRDAGYTDELKYESEQNKLTRTTRTRKRNIV